MGKVWIEFASARCIPTYLLSLAFHFIAVYNCNSIPFMLYVILWLCYISPAVRNLCILGVFFKFMI